MNSNNLPTVTSHYEYERDTMSGPPRINKTTYECKKKTTIEAKIQLLKEFEITGNKKELAAKYNISRTTLYTYLTDARQALAAIAHEEAKLNSIEYSVFGDRIK